MLGFFKRRKEAKAMADVGRAFVASVGDDAAADINKLFDVIIQSNDEFLEAFKERLVGVGMAPGISPKQEAEIELSAAMDNWNEQREELRHHGEKFLESVFEIAETIDATDQIRGLVDKRWGDVDLAFKAQMVIAFGEATEGLSEEPNPCFDIETASLGAIIFEIVNKPGQVPTQELIQYYHRLVDIACFDNHISDEDQQTAKKAAEALKADVLAGFADNPDAMEAFIEASDNHMDNLPFYGRGSLQWLATEHAITATQHIDFIAQPEFADLLPAHLTILDDGTINDIRYPVVRSLIKARRVSPDQSDTQTLSSLIAKSDRSLDILLKADELRILRAADQDYAATEALVAKIMNS